MSSLPDLRILTADRCSDYQIFEFSLPIAVLTTRSSNSHYRSLFSLPDLRILTTDRCCHPVTTRYPNSHYRLMLWLPGSNFHHRSLFSLPVLQKFPHCRSLSSLPDLRTLTADRCCHYQSFEFSLPIDVVTTRSMNSQYRLLSSPLDRWILPTDRCRSLLSLPDQWTLTTDCCRHYQMNEFSLPVAPLTTRSMNSHSGPCGHYQINAFSLLIGDVTTRTMNPHYRSLLSLSDHWMLTTDRCRH